MAESHSGGNGPGSNGHSNGVLDSRVPDGPMADKWTDHKFSMKLVKSQSRHKRPPRP